MCAIDDFFVAAKYCIRCGALFVLSFLVSFLSLKKQTEAAVENAIKLDGSTFKERQLKVSAKRVNDPNYYAGAGGGAPGGRGGRGFRGGGRGYRGGYRGGRGGRGGFRGGGRGGRGGYQGGYHPYY
mmetsp:Transcript_29017/g.42367  ORF Transcript_29017/g.42367 Transcript_29017/m.42367 type:complete len:126 (+) Transcript_29017:923-1300(+)